MPTAVIPQPFRKGIARVQSKVANTGNSAGVASLTITLDAATTSGNVVIVAVNAPSTVAMKITSTHGIFQDLTPIGYDSTGVVPAHIFLGQMFGADTALVIALMTGGNFTCAAIAVEYSGFNLTPDNVPGVSQGILASPTTGAVTANNNNSLYIGCLGQRVTSSTQNSTWASSPSNSFTIVGQITTNINTTNNDRATAFTEAFVGTPALKSSNVVSGFGLLRYAGTLATFYELPNAGW